MELLPSRKATLTKSSFHFRTCFPSSTSKSWFPVQNCRKLKAHLFLLFTCPPAPGILVLMAAARSTNQCQRGQQLAANWLPFPWVAFLAIVWFRSWEPWLQVSPVAHIISTLVDITSINFVFNLNFSQSATDEGDQRRESRKQ